MTTPAPVLLPLAEAAARLGLSQPAVRRRLKAGKLTGERRLSASGFQWWIAVPDTAAADGTATATADATAIPDDGGTAPPAGGATVDVTAAAADGADAPGPATTALETLRAEGMAHYTRTLLEPLHARLEAQATTIGRLENENEHLRARITELEAAPAPETPNGTPLAEPERRGWWQRTWGWLTAGS